MMNYLSFLPFAVYAEGEEAVTGNADTAAVTEETQGDTTGDATTTQSAGMAEMIQPIIMMVLIVVVFYFILIRPQKKKEKSLKEMIAALKVGDEVVTVGGLHGKIVRVKDETFVIESGAGANKSTIKIERSAVSRVTKQKGDDDKYAPPVEAADGDSEE